MELKRRAVKRAKPLGFNQRNAKSLARSHVWLPLLCEPQHTPSQRTTSRALFPLNKPAAANRSVPCQWQIRTNGRLNNQIIS